MLILVTGKAIHNTYMYCISLCYGSIRLRKCESVSKSPFDQTTPEPAPTSSMSTLRSYFNWCWFYMYIIKFFVAAKQARAFAKVLGLGFNEAKVDSLCLIVTGARYITGGEREECQHATKS